MSNATLRADFPVGSKVRDSRYGDVVFEVVDYWRGDLRLKEPTRETTHCCPVSGATLIATPRTVLVHLNVTLPARPAPGETKSTADDLQREVEGLLAIGRDDAENCPALASALEVCIPLAEEVN